MKRATLRPTFNTTGADLSSVAVTVTGTASPFTLKLMELLGLSSS